MLYKDFAPLRDLNLPVDVVVSVPNSFDICLANNRSNILIGFIDNNTSTIYRRVNLKGSLTPSLNSSCEYRTRYLGHFQHSIILAQMAFTSILSIVHSTDPSLFTPVQNTRIYNFFSNSSSLHTTFHLSYLQSLPENIDPLNLAEKLIYKSSPTIEHFISKYKALHILFTYHYLLFPQLLSEILDNLELAFSYLSSLPSEDSIYKSCCVPTTIDLNSSSHLDYLPCLQSSYCRLIQDREKGIPLIQNLSQPLPNNFGTLSYIYDNNITHPITIFPISLPPICFLMDLFGRDNYILSLPPSYTSKSPLYYINFGNLSHSGSICFGSYCTNPFDLATNHSFYFSSLFDLSTSGFVLGLNLKDFTVSYNNRQYHPPHRTTFSLYNIIPNDPLHPIHFLYLFNHFIYFIRYDSSSSSFSSSPSDRISLY